MSSHTIHHLLHVYGLAIVFAGVALQAVGAPVPGTTVLVAAAVYAAASHGLPIVGVILAGILGAVVGTTLGFVIGRWGGEPLLLRVGRLARQSPERVQRLRRELAERGAAWLFLARFVTGGRNVAGLLAGASGMAFGRFFVVTAAAATVWAVVSGLEYYFFGDALAGASTWVQVVLVIAGLVWLGLSVGFLRRRALRRLAGAPQPSGSSSSVSSLE